MAFLRDLQSNSRRFGAPVSIGIIILAAANFLISWAVGGGSWNAYLFFNSAAPLSLPWTFLTWPFTASADFIGILFMPNVFYGSAQG